MNPVFSFVLILFLACPGMARPVMGGRTRLASASSDVPAFSFTQADGTLLTRSALEGRRLCLVFFHPESSIASRVLVDLAAGLARAPQPTTIVAIATVDGEHGESSFRELKLPAAPGLHVVRLGPADSRAGFGADECCDSLVVYSNDGRREVAVKLAETTDRIVDLVLGKTSGAADPAVPAGRDYASDLAALPASVRSGGEGCAVVVGVFSDLCPECEASSRLGYLDRLARRQGVSSRVVAVLPASYSAIDLENLRTVYEYQVELVSADTSVFRGHAPTGAVFAVFGQDGELLWMEQPGLGPRDVARSVEAAVRSECAK